MRPNFSRYGYTDFFNLFDACAVCPVTGFTRWTQTKTNALPSPAYRQRLAEFVKGREHCSVELWVWYDRVKEPRVIVL